MKVVVLASAERASEDTETVRDALSELTAALSLGCAEGRIKLKSVSWLRISFVALHSPKQRAGSKSCSIPPSREAENKVQISGLMLRTSFQLYLGLYIW